MAVRTRGFYKGTRLEKVDCIIVGAGVAGLAIGAAAAEAGLDTLVLEPGKSAGLTASLALAEWLVEGLTQPGRDTAF